jgi:hypothetical protein
MGVVSLGDAYRKHLAEHSLPKTAASGGYEKCVVACDRRHDVGRGFLSVGSHEKSIGVVVVVRLEEWR